jgi:hypothetical protein
MPEQTSREDALARTMAWFEQAVPKPNSKNVHVQLGCHFEEVVEMLVEIHGTNPFVDKLLRNAQEALTTLADYLKTSEASITIPDDIGFLDALCDQLVTLAGVGHMRALPVVEALREINGSNWSKFVNDRPVFNDYGKIGKGPNYHKPNLTKFFIP